MQGKTHLITGLTAGLACGVILEASPLNLALATGAGGLAGLVPDWLQINMPGVKQVKGLFGHRGFSHWLWTALACAYLTTLLKAPPSLSIAFLCGWLSHILLDTISNGVPAFWPFGRLTLARIKTGSKYDTLIGAAFLIFFLALATTSIIIPLITSNS